MKKIILFIIVVIIVLAGCELNNNPFTELDTAKFMDNVINRNKKISNLLSC